MRWKECGIDEAASGRGYHAPHPLLVAAPACDHDERGEVRALT